MLKQENKRTVTVTCLGTMNNDEAMDILATYIAKKIYEKRYEENIDLFLKGEIAYDLLTDPEQDEIEIRSLIQRRDEIQAMLDEGYVYSEEEEIQCKKELSDLNKDIEEFYK